MQIELETIYGGNRNGIARILRQPPPPRDDPTLLKNHDSNQRRMREVTSEAIVELCKFAAADTPLDRALVIAADKLAHELGVDEDFWMSWWRGCEGGPRRV